MEKNEIWKLELIKTFWLGKNNPNQGHNSEEWFDKYYKEILFHIYGYKTIVDVGCGSGENPVRMSKDFEKVIGLDYTESMIDECKTKLKKAGITNVEVYVENAINVDRVVKEKVDVVFCNTVMQHLTINQAEEFIKRSKDLLNDDGIIFLMNVLNSNLEHLYYIGLFKNFNLKVSPGELIKKLIAHRFLILKRKIQNKLRNKPYEYEPIIGFWHSTSDYIAIANKLDLTIEFFQSVYPPYGYRFHAKLSKKNPKI